MFQSNGSLLMAPLFPPPGPVERGSPPSKVISRRYDFPLAHSRSLMASVAGPTRSSFVRARRSAPAGAEVAVGPGTIYGPAFPVPACRARGRERDLTGSLAIRPMPLPCSRTPVEPKRPRLWRSPRCCPRVPQTEGLSRRKISRLTQGFSIRCLRFTSDVAATHARLASGWRAAPLPGGRRTLWTASKGFRSHFRPPFQGLACRKWNSFQTRRFRPYRRVNPSTRPSRCS